MLTTALLEKMAPNTEFSTCFDEERRRTILRGAFESYYFDAPDIGVVFDTNRIWTSKLALLKDLFPRVRVICCVRDLGWIIDSIEVMLRKNPLYLSRVFDFKPGTSIYSRVEVLMNSEKGLIGAAWSALREAWYSNQAQSLIVVRYETLVRQPGMVMARLYQELGEEPFTHDFENVAYAASDFDADLGMPGLHTVKRGVRNDARKPCIPPDLFAKHADLSFWTKPELNRGGITVL